MRRNTAWAFAGNSVYAGCQWAVFVLIVQALKVEDAGAYAYATAVTGPAFVLASVRLRNLLATAVDTTEDFSDYLNARLMTTAVAIAVSLAVGFTLKPHADSLAVIAVMTAGRACDAISDLCHGLFQRDLDMRSPAIGLAINGVASVSLVAVALALWGSLVLATAAYAAGSLVALAAWDLPRSGCLRYRRSGSTDDGGSDRHPITAAWRLIRRALPLGLSSAVGSVQLNVPRYTIASLLGPAMLAQFAAISYITMVGHLIVNATSQAALPLLARDVHVSETRYRARLTTLVAGTLVIGGLTLIAARVFGQAALTLLYGPEYAADAGVLVWLVAATVITFASVFLGTGTTARHRFWTQLLVSVTSCTVVAACTVPFVRRYALYGAAWTLLLGAVVEFSAYAFLVLRDRKPASASVAGPLVESSGAASPAMASRRGVHVLNVFGQLERGGAELRAVELAEAFPPDRVRSDFLALTGLDGVLDSRVRAAGGAVIKCRLDWKFPRRFYCLLRERRYDVVHSHVHYFSGVILFFARIAGVRGRVSHLHTARVNDRDDTRRRRLQLALCRHLIRWNATDIIAAGEGAMSAAWGPEWKTDSRCHVIYNTVRFDRLQPAADLRAGRPTIVNVASLKPLKNQLRLIEILRRLSATHPAVRLRLIGKEIDDYGVKVRDAAAAAGVADRVDIVGEVDDAMPALAHADLMILPSVWEGLPCVVLESCAVGTPVLASDLPGTREIARHLGLVHLIPLEADDDAWAAAAVQIIERGRLDASAAAEDLAKSPFMFDRSSRAHFEIWSRLCATA